MPTDTTIVFGIPVPSVDPVFLAVVRFHIVVGVACVLAGPSAMLSYKGRGRHSTLDRSTTGAWRSSSPPRPCSQRCVGQRTIICLSLAPCP